MEKLTSEELAVHLRLLPNWKVQGETIFRKCTFPDFTEAFAFMTKVAAVAENMNHHPDWSNVYNTVSISLSTHDAGGVTEQDISLAKEIDSFVA